MNPATHDLSDVSSRPGAEFPLAGRVAVISGAGKGLGRSFALHLAGLGAAVVVNNRRRTYDSRGASAAETVAAEIVESGGEALVEESDAADPDSGQRIVAATLQRFGRIDICIANAAVGSPAMFHTQDITQFESVMNINCLGATRLLRAAVTPMRSAGFGRIVVVASTAGLYGDVGLSAYAASKGALIGLGRTLALEGARRNVLTNMLLPYATTQMTTRSMPGEISAAASPDAVAPVVGALVRDDCNLNGECIVTAGGRLRRAAPVEWDTVLLPALDPTGMLSPHTLSDLLGESASGTARPFASGTDSFTDFMTEAAPALGQPR